MTYLFLLFFLHSYIPLASLDLNCFRGSLSICVPSVLYPPFYFKIKLVLMLNWAFQNTYFCCSYDGIILTFILRIVTGS